MYTVTVKVNNQSCQFSNKVEKPSPSIARQAIAPAGFTYGEVQFSATIVTPDGFHDDYVAYRVSPSGRTVRIY